MKTEFSSIWIPNDCNNPTGKTIATLRKPNHLTDWVEYHPVTSCEWDIITGFVAGGLLTGLALFAFILSTGGV